MQLKDKVCLITGGGTGLGREISLQLAAEGMKLAIGYSRSQADADKTVSDIKASGGEALAFQADLSNVSECAHLVQGVESMYGRLDLLMHNAATTRFISFEDLDAVTEEIWDDIFNLNTKAAFFLAKAAANILKRDGGGQIINTSSIAGITPGGSSLPYAVSKAALIHLTRALATSLAPDIRVNAVAPGLLITRWVSGFEEAQLDAFKENALLKKAADLSDTAAAFVMLAKNSSITGQTIVVDAGQLR